ncbi:hypothetical protein CYMTET_15581 [Cymbomonas tetramitiformis]|uniref:Uncharacterized protein n=1 Tax=Cymbomonas tetramitiformis TaxID=36881 RepID=A0AAE0L8V1_9CHLO|nr:hypothetical protein CYMTET_15581 [Cymbomonas tetramitiformis]
MSDLPQPDAEAMSGEGAMKQQTPLHLAAENGHLAILEALIGGGAAVNYHTLVLQTPLHLAAVHGHTAAVKALMQAGADYGAVDKEAKCKAIQDLPKPQDKTGLRSILGMMNYYKGLVGEPGGPNYSEMARPLNDLLKKGITDIKGAWGKEQDQALQDLKDALCVGRCLRPIDYDRPLILYTDWSTYGIGAVLGQKDGNGEEYICMAISRSLSKTERQYASFKGEMLAVVWAVRTLRQYLHGVHFTLVTDHSPLTTLMEKSDLQGQHLRWAISLQEVDFTVQYRPGAKNSNADVPSRYPLPSTPDETGARHDREEASALHAGVGEFCAKSFCDSLYLIRAGALREQWWVMVCGFPCQDLSAVGTLKGLAGRHSKLFYEVVRLLSTLQQLQRQQPPGYILENVSPLAHRPGTKIRDEVFPYIAGVIGQPVSFDAARAGSYAHRLRAYWSNLFQNYQFRSVMSKVVRPKDRFVSSIICEGWQPRPMVRSDRTPHYMVDVVGKPLRALPTIMATQGSRAFRAPRLGTVVRSAGADSEEETREVNLDEKSRAMGYSASDLRMADGLSDEELASILGLAMDRRAMELLLAVAEASRKGLPHSEESPMAENFPGQPIAVDNNWADHARSDLQQRHALLAKWVGNSNAYTQQVAKTMSHHDWEERLQTMCSQGQKGVRGLGASGQRSGTNKKPWQHYTVEQYSRRHRSRFMREGGAQQRCTEVPAWSPPGEEKEMRLPRLTCTTRLTELVASVAEQHADRDKHRDIYDDEWCLRWLKSNGSVELPEGEARRVKRRAARHRWDEVASEIYMITLSGKEMRIPKPADRLALVREYHARAGHWGIRRTQHLVWQRHWWADLKKDVEAVVTQCETCQRVKTHYAREEALVSPLEIKSFMYRWSLDLAWPSRRMTRSGNSRVLIMTKHYTTIIYKRVVRTIKFCFKKLALEKGLDYEWDEQLWPLVLSYNAARQESTGVAPFTLLFAQEAVVPPDLKQAPNLDFDLEVKEDKDYRVKDLLQRAQFKVGDFVYIRQKPRSGMEVATKPVILKLVKIQRDGVVVLEDAARLKEKSTVQSIAP